VTATFEESYTEALNSYVDELREYISAIQRPRGGDASWVEAMRLAGEELSAAGSRLRASLSARAAHWASLDAVTERLRAYTEGLAAGPRVAALKAQRDALARSYEELLLELRARRVARAEALSRSRQLKPTNYVRNLFHAAMGIVAVVLYQLVLSQQQALLVLGSIFAVFATLEITRRFSTRWNDFLVDEVFGAISRPSERYRINSSTVYVTALFLITALCPKLAVEAAILVLGLGDPAASLVGKRWGRRKLFRDKSYAGSLALLLTSFAAVSLFLWVAGPAYGMARALGSAAAIAAVGALTELLSSRIDDNFSLPLACAAVGALIL
jgi:dolichol kinase